MRRRDASETSIKLVVSAVLLALLSIHAPSVSAELSEREIKTFRQSGRIPDHERTMTIDELFDLFGVESWAPKAIGLRCLLADDQTRRSIYEKLIQAAIEKEVDPHEEIRGAGVMNRVRAIIVLGQQDRHRDEAVAAILTVLNAVQRDLLIESACYSTLGELGGPLAIETLKEALLQGPLTKSEARELNFGFRGVGELYLDIYNSIASCGPDAGQARMDIDIAHGEYLRDARYQAFRSVANEEVVPYLLGKVREAQLAGDVRFQALAMRAVAARASTFTAETRQEIFDLLLDHAEDPDHRIRVAVVQCLAQAGDASHLPLLERMQADAESVVRKLFVMRPGSDDPNNVVLTPTESFPVRDAAARAIENIRQRLINEAEAARERAIDEQGYP